MKRRFFNIVTFISITLQTYKVCWGRSQTFQCEIPGECLYSNALQVIQDSGDPMECLKACKRTNHCKWYTHYDNTKTCVLFSGCKSRAVLHCSHCISGQVECHSHHRCDIPGRCHGIMTHFPIARNLDECQSRCLSNNYCFWYSFNNATNKCLLTDDCTEIIECDTCVTYHRGCTYNKKKEQDILLLRQDLSAEVNYFDENTIRSLNKDNTSALMYSRLEELNDFRHASGYFYFKLCYPKLALFSKKEVCYEFRQKSNPDTLVHQGFEAISLYVSKRPSNFEDHPEHPFAGLRSDNTDDTFLDCDINGSGYSIGTKKIQGSSRKRPSPDEKVPRLNRKIPGPYLDTGLVWIDLVELYARV